MYRIATDAPHGAGFLKQIGRLALVNIIGFGGAALLLLPFLEYLSRSFNAHAGPFTPGLDIVIHRRDLFGYLVPLAAGPLGGGNGVYGYFGMTATMLAVLAVATWIREWRSRQATVSADLVPFFAVAVVLMILKRYGISLVQWIGYLPLFRMIVFYKYLEPLIGFGVAVLCGIGLSHVIGRKLHAKTAAVAIAIVLTMFVCGYVAFLPYAADRPNAWMFFGSTTTGLVVLVVAAAIVLAAAGHRSEGASAGAVRDKTLFAGPALMVCLAGELFLIFIYPMFYKYSEQPDKSVNAFSRAPYITWLQQKDARTFRIFARNGVLTPNWPGVFGLSDIRDLDAMYDKRYLPFVRAFFPPQGPGKDLFDRFTGMNLDYSFSSPSARRMLQLSSVRYLITDTPFASGRGDLQFADPVFNLVYNHEVQIYEYPAILPRAAVFYGVETELMDDDSLKRLLDPAHDIFQRAVVALSTISSDSARKIDQINGMPPRKATAAYIARQESREVDIEAKLDQPGLLTLNDTDYPGWRADVDGSEVPILTVNYLFRGVLLEKGAHQVRFRYEPASFRWGTAVSVLSLIVLVLAARFHPRLGLG
ncbi:MAG TPA: YfhO family protein [Bryobacteraceae bacterium]|nr:YfhO family protein [Bryobacteraceae bacterium]